MKNKKTLIAIIIIISFIIVSFGSFIGGSYLSFKAEKKAIIILPGLFASGLYDSSTGKGVWDPFESLDLSFSDFMDETGGLKFDALLPILMSDTFSGELDKLFANDNMGTPDSLLNMMAMNEDGTSVVDTVVAVPWTNQTRLKYGVINAQKDMYNSINNRYGSDYDVQIFNYDFRQDNRQNAILLENFINEQGYTDVILVSHSNGGQVASVYLARSEANREKVSKYISYNSPYYGSYSAITILEDTAGMISGMTSSLGNSPLTAGLVTNINEVFSNQFMRLLNMWAVYQLLPSYEILSTEYNGDQAMIYIDGVAQTFSSSEELWEFYCSRPWAKLTNGELRKPMAEWQDYKDSMMVILPSGEKVLSTTLIDTTYYSGTNVITTDKIYYTRNEDDTLTLTSTGTTMHGDGTVLLNSAVGLVDDPSRIVLFDGVTHYGVNTDYVGFAEADTYAVLDPFVEKDLPWYYKLWKNILN